MLSQVIKWSTLAGGCTDLSHVLILNPKIEKMGTFKKNGDPTSEKGPHGDPGTQMGTYVGAVHLTLKIFDQSDDWKKKNKKTIAVQ